MIKMEHTWPYGFDAAIRGMRNPLNSWDNSDSTWIWPSDSGWEFPTGEEYIIGDNDHKLMMKLRNAGTDHRKFMRMIVVYADITAPLYWWKEFDTYKIGTVSNSCSTMHKIADKEFVLEDFSYEHLVDTPLVESEPGVPELFNMQAKHMLEITIGVLNAARLNYLKTQDKKYWYSMIQLLPSSYNQKRTVMLNYEVLANMYESRKNHKLDEWRDFCKWVENLPYSELITGEK